MCFSCTFAHHRRGEKEEREGEGGWGEKMGKEGRRGREGTPEARSGGGGAVGHPVLFVLSEVLRVLKVK